jgi:ankyrin repeat protein
MGLKGYKCIPWGAVWNFFARFNMSNKIHRWWLRRRIWWLRGRMPPVLRLLCREERFNLNELEQLIAAGADVNARWGKDGRTALLVSAFMSGPGNSNRAHWLEACRLLLEAGADPNVAFHCAHEDGNVELLILLLNSGACPSCPRCNVVVNDECRTPPIFRLWDREGGFQLSELEELIASGVDVDARERSDGETPLICAARVDRPWDPNFRGALEVCRVLLEAGADPNADCEGFYFNRSIRPSPIYFAYLNGNVELLELLLEFGANPRSEAWSHSVDVVPQPDAWLERQRPEIRDRLRQWKAEQEEKRLEETLPDATETAPKIRARL